MTKSLQEIQVEIGIWSRVNFGDQTSKVTGQSLGPLAPLLGVVEELGELCHAVLKHHQGIRKFSDDMVYSRERDDAIADVLIYLCDFACREGVDLGAVLERTWAKVQQRNWQQNPDSVPAEQV
jgi:NTP pyrophosphatase (non-canonical NTP hydrolase)